MKYSNHDIKHGSLLYIIEEKNKVLFYATDTSKLTEIALEQLKGYKLDCIIMDHTFGNVDGAVQIEGYLFEDAIDEV